MNNELRSEMINPIVRTTINEALKNADKHYDNVDYRVKAFYWLAVVAIKCLIKLALYE